MSVNRNTREISYLGQPGLIQDLEYLCTTRPGSLLTELDEEEFAPQGYLLEVHGERQFVFRLHPYAAPTEDTVEVRTVNHGTISTARTIYKYFYPNGIIGMYCPDPGVSRIYHLGIKGAVYTANSKLFFFREFREHEPEAGGWRYQNKFSKIFFRSSARVQEGNSNVWPAPVLQYMTERIGQAADMERYLAPIGSAVALPNMSELLNKFYTSKQAVVLARMLAKAQGGNR